MAVLFIKCLCTSQIKAVNYFKLHNLHYTELQRGTYFLFLLTPECQDSFRELLFPVSGTKIGTQKFRVPLTTQVRGTSAAVPEDVCLQTVVVHI